MTDGSTAMGPVLTIVHDLERQIRFYGEILGLAVSSTNDRSAALGAGGRELLRLREEPEARQYRDTAANCVRIVSVV